MRYDAESGKILISVKELVTLARRGISPTVPADEDEPRGDETGRRVRAKLLENTPTRQLQMDFEIGEYSFRLFGTPDGVEDGVITVLRSNYGKPTKEEIAQSRGESFIYGYMLSSVTGRSDVLLKNLFYNTKDEVTEEKTAREKQAKLGEFFSKCKATLLVFGKPEVERVTKRLPTLKKMKFPYANIREGQGEFIKAVYRALASGRALYASAPTGTGKTVSALYPALRGLGDGRYDKIFYLTPKTTTKEAAKECLSLFSERGAAIRGVCLTSKERICKNRRVCRDDRALCPNAKCNKLPEAVIELYSLEKAVIDKEEIDEVARKYSVCPHELELTYSELCDVVICDFNYVFDPSAYIRRYFEEGGKYALLVDESHNLVERAREMYSAEISLGEMRYACESDSFAEHSTFKMRLFELCDALEKLLLPYLNEEIRESDKGERRGGVALSDVPGDMYGIFDELTELLESEYLKYKKESAVDNDAKKTVKELLYSIKKVNKALQLFDERFKLFLFFTNGEIRVKLFCLDTGVVIARALTKCYGAVFFSATLSPLNYYKALLGADGTSSDVEVSSPFTPEQLSVSIIDKISTRYSERERTLGAVCRTIAATLSARRGNYMVFSSSFEYSEALSQAFREKYPKIEVLSQKADMSVAEREEFLEKFKNPSGKYLVGFCVMGGVYSEGIDLAGDSLIGAVVVGIGMPSLSFEREAMTEYFNDRYDEGKQYAYVYPGMNRVFQAAGRVIRREEDRGVIVLIDDRFADPIYKKSIPSLWRGMRYVSDAKELKERIEKFWRSVDEEKNERR